MRDRKVFFTTLFWMPIELTIGSFVPRGTRYSSLIGYPLVPPYSVYVWCILGVGYI